MSWNFSATCEQPGDLELLAGEEPCPGCAKEEGVDLDEEYTYNVSPMYYRAFAGTELKEGGIRGIDGLRAARVVHLLDEAIRYFVENGAELIALNPANGWGDYAGALQLLRTLREHGEAHPRAIYKVT